MKKYILASIVCFLSIFLYAQQGDGGNPVGQTIFQKNNVEIPMFRFNSPNIEKLKAEDKINDSLKLGPWRFGYNYDTNIDFLSDGKWFTTKNGDQIWLLKINAKEAKSINLTFSNSVIPEGNKLFIYNPEQTQILGKFTQKHFYNGELGAELIDGENVIVEYVVPAKNKAQKGMISISKVTYGYRTANEFQQKAFGSSQNCEMNVNCPDGSPYLAQRNATLMLVTGSNGFCTGTLINNTQYDGKPYVLTANHCTTNHGNYSNWIFRFKWQAEGCDNPDESPAYESLSGAELLAKRKPTDFCLVEIKAGLEDGIVPEICSPYYAGWDRSEAIPTSTFSIHHPDGDIKKISFDDDAPLITQGMSSTQTNSTWQVVWDRNTTTEGGSSGGPLFNQNGQIIGQLWGGNASCLNTGTGHDYFGRFSKSWDSESEKEKQLKYWLDPNENGAEEVLGFDPYHSVSEYDAGVYEILGTTENECNTSFEPQIKIQNNGNQTLTSLTIIYTYNNESSKELEWTGSLELYQTEIVTLPTIENRAGENSIHIELVDPNGEEDENLDNNEIATEYSAFPEGNAAEFRFYMGCWPDEITWFLQNENGDTLYSGGGYPGGQGNVNFYIVEQLCLPDDCYQLTLLDSYGDGVQGGVFGCDYSGRMTVVHEGDTLAYLAEEDANFGSKVVYDFCIGEPVATQEETKKKTVVYPNPNRGEFEIKTQLSGQKKIELRSLTGQIIWTTTTDKQIVKFNEKQLSKGMYIISITSKVSQHTQKIIVQ